MVEARTNAIRSGQKKYRCPVCFAVVRTGEYHVETCPFVARKILDEIVLGRDFHGIIPRSASRVIYAIDKILRRLNNE